MGILSFLLRMNFPCISASLIKAMLYEHCVLTSFLLTSYPVSSKHSVVAPKMHFQIFLGLIISFLNVVTAAPLQPISLGNYSHPTVNKRDTSPICSEEQQRVIIDASTEIKNMVILLISFKHNLRLLTVHLASKNSGPDTKAP